MIKEQWTRTVAEGWGLFLPPARPSLSELTAIEQYVVDLKKNNPELQVAILGSTPEFRDICQAYNIAYKCIDYNKQNFIDLRKYMLHKDTDDKVIVGDWREMDFSDKFHLFIGDLATTVTPVEDHEKIYESIIKHGYDKAEFILKVPVRENNDRLTHQEIFENYRKNLSYMEPFSAVWIDILLADYNLEKDTMHCQISDEELHKSFVAGIIIEDEFISFKKRWDVLGDFQMNIPLRKEFLDKLSKYFD